MLSGAAVAAVAAAPDGSSSSSSVGSPTGALALQLLQRLSSRGVLEQHAAAPQLLSSVHDALDRCSLGEAELCAVRLVQRVLALHLGSGAPASPRGSSKSPLTLAQQGEAVVCCCSGVLQLVVTGSMLECLAAAAGTGGVAAVAAWRAGCSKAFWGYVAGVVSLPAAQPLLLRCAPAASSASGQWLLDHDVGPDPVDCLLSVSLQPGRHVLQPICYLLLLEASPGGLLEQLSFAAGVAAAAAAAAGGGGTDGLELEGSEAEADVPAALVRVGLRPSMAAALTLTGAQGRGLQRCRGGRA